jgi:hypothetical protein
VSENLVMRAIHGLASPVQVEAVQVIHLSAAGFGTVEIASHLGITWRRVNTLKDEGADSLISAYLAAGYSSGETIRTLGVPTSTVLAVAGRNSGDGAL